VSRGQRNGSTRPYSQLSRPELTKHYSMKTYEEVNARIHVLLTSVLVRGELSASRSGRFTSEEGASGTRSVGYWAGPRTARG
jgi:hypothetical protein